MLDIIKIKKTSTQPETTRWTRKHSYNVAAIRNKITSNSAVHIIILVTNVTYERFIEIIGKSYK